MAKKPKVLTPEQVEEIRTKDFFDCILPSTVKFATDHYTVGDSHRCVWVIREYPPSTDVQALLSQLADRNGVTLRFYFRLVEAMEQRKIVQNAMRSCAAYSLTSWATCSTPISSPVRPI